MKFLNYPYELQDESFPTADAVKEMMSKKDRSITNIFECKM